MIARPDIATIAGRRPGRRRGWLLVAALAVAVVGGAAAVIPRWHQPEVPTYTTVPVVRQDLTVTVGATGTVEPTNKVQISSELSGTVRSVDADYNSVVKVGQPLATLDTQVLEANLEHERASVAAAGARIDEALATLDEKRTAYARANRLKDSGLSSEELYLAALADTRRAEAALTGARADLRVAQATLTLNEADLAKATLRSPINGVVLDRAVEVGQIVAASFSAPVLFTLAEDLTRMELMADIDEADIGRVAVGDAATFTVEAYRDRTFPARITQVRYASQTVDGVVTYKAELAIENSDLSLRPGMTAVAAIVVENVSGALVVPNAALRFAPVAAPGADEARSGRPSGLLGLLFPRRERETRAQAPKVDIAGKRTIYVLRDGIAVAVQVVTGPTDGSVTAIDGALAEGDHVITAEAPAP